MPFGLQPIHLLVVGFVALIIFGPRRLPQLGRWIGRTFTEFRKGTRELSEGIKEEISRAGSVESAVAPPAHAEAHASAPSAGGAPPPQAVSGSYCTKCGALNPADARYCNKCGVPIQTVMQSPP